MLFQIHVECRTSGKVLYIFLSVELELVHDVESLVLYDVEVAVVAVSRNIVSVFLVPLCVLYTNVLSRNHLAVEHCLLGAVLLVVLLNKSENFLNIMCILRVVVYLVAQELGSLHQTVDTNRQILSSDIDVTGIEQRKHSLCLQVFQVLVVGKLYLVYEIYHLSQELHVIHLMLYGILDTAVQVDCQHALASGRNSACSQSIAESVVLDLVPQTAAA